MVLARAEPLKRHPAPEPTNAKRGVAGDSTGLPAADRDATAITNAERVAAPSVGALDEGARVQAFLLVPHTAIVNAEDRYGQPWTAEEVTLALYLYCQIPFAKTKANNSMVQALAEHLGRTPASVARKLGNFGSFDPTLAERDVSGLGHASKTDRELWDRYAKDWSSLVDAAVTLWGGVVNIAEPFSTEYKEVAQQTPSGPSQTQRLVNVRLHQAFFRQTVLTSYSDVCCVCGIEVPALLTASHIVPWAHDERLRADPTNGLCLCALHDRAFDRGLIAISDEGRVLTSPRLLRCKSDASRLYLTDLEGSPLTMPHRFAPNPGYVAWHRENVFLY